MKRHSILRCVMLSPTCCRRWFISLILTCGASPTPQEDVSMLNHLRSTLRVAFLIIGIAIPAAAQTTRFTYQGSLKDGGNPASGNYDFQFSLFDQLSSGTQLGTTQTVSNVPVSNGAFTVSIDFGSC